MDETIAELRGLLRRATEGPFQSFGRDILAFGDNGFSYNLAHVASRLGDADQDTANAAVFVAAVNALPTLLDALTTSRDRERELEAALEPFARAAGALRPDDADTMRPASVQAIHFRRARNALSSKDQDHG